MWDIMDINFINLTEKGWIIIVDTAVSTAVSGYIKHLL